MNRIARMIAAAGCSSLLLAGCGGESPAEPTQNATPWTEVAPSTLKDIEGGLQYAILSPGSGRTARSGDRVRMHYTGWLMDGARFDSSVDQNRPIEFVLGRGRVIRGWDLGVVGMKVGEKRQLRIPSALGYGAEGTPDGTIPPNSDLIFDVELLEILPAE